MASRYQSRKNNIFDPLRHGSGQANSKEPFKVSRSKIDLFIECPRCFYLDRRLGVSRPSLPGFTLNIAVDHLLKKEFDVHRAKGTPHPMMTHYGIDAVPFEHPNMSVWRENFVGVQTLHTPTNLIIFGAVDDIWINPEGELHVVDYKATSKKEKPTLDGRWGEQYKRQMEVYQWLLRENGFRVSEMGYFLYVNGRKDREAFDGKLEFDIDIIPYEGSTDWIEPLLLKMKGALVDERVPSSGELCEYCPYREGAGKALREKHEKLVKGKRVAEQKETGTKTLF